jgi:hypothetical protein
LFKLKKNKNLFTCPNHLRIKNAVLKTQGIPPPFISKKNIFLT